MPGQIATVHLLGVRYARREQPVCDGLRHHVGECAGIKVMQQRLAERLHELSDAAPIAFNLNRASNSLAGRLGELC